VTSGPSTSPGLATLPVLRALLDHARSKGYPGGVLGVRAQPIWSGRSSFVHQDVPVRVVVCTSSLAVREALQERDPQRWLVLLTDRDEADLGVGILSHLVFHRLRTPDPWDAVRTRFAATAIDALLTGDPRHRELAVGLLAASPVPPSSWPPAPGGVLTYDHALASTACLRLGVADVGTEIDAATVLQWTTGPSATAHVADLRSLAGDALTDAVLDWLASRLGPAGPHVGALLAAGEVADIVPLGLVLDITARDTSSERPEDAQVAREVLIRLEARLSGRQPTAQAVRIWAAEASTVIGGLILDWAARLDVDRLLTRADLLVQELRAEDLTDHSDLLPSGLASRLGRLAEAILSAVATPSAPAQVDVDEPVVAADAAARVDQAWSAVERHRLADHDKRRPAALAAVRLVRWLALPSSVAGANFRALAARHRDADAWVDAAVKDAATGVGDARLDAALMAVLALVQRRRDQHDRAFGIALSTEVEAEQSTVLPIEDVLPRLVLPLARRVPILLLVVDAMSLSASIEILEDVLDRTREGWVEALPTAEKSRVVALTVLPSVTQHSRASLLCGELRSGGQDVERQGFAELMRANGVEGAILFHKRPLDESLPGQALAQDVATAVDDVVHRRIVTCVLNTIDDALDRSDPGGTDWTLETVKHLRPLLARARVAGRTVVLTADHGHLIERRQGRYQASSGISSGRSRSVAGTVSDGEVVVAGRRVLDHGGRAVLAVDERLRYGPLKAGYHGGASPAEVLVPVCILCPGVLPDHGYDAAGPQEPSWWWSPSVLEVQVSPGVTHLSSSTEELPLFSSTVTGELTASPNRALATAVVASATYTAQRRLAQPAVVSKERVEALLQALLDADTHRLPPERVALALGEPVQRLRGAIAQVQRLLNVEGYAVLRVDADGVTLILDVPLLREQFDLRT
jgi:hypothetical protein